MRSDIHTVVNIKLTVLRIVIPCNLVDMYSVFWKNVLPPSVG